MKELLQAGFVAVALAGAAIPALAFPPEDVEMPSTTYWPDVDFAWYLNVGKPLATPVEATPAPRAGYIWAPGRYETVGARQQWVAGRWVKDDFEQQVAALQRGE
jgi:hypothetical protein